MRPAPLFPLRRFRPESGFFPCAQLPLRKAPLRVLFFVWFLLHARKHIPLAMHGEHWLPDPSPADPMLADRVRSWVIIPIWWRQPRRIKASPLVTRT